MIASSYRLPLTSYMFTFLWYHSKTFPSKRKSNQLNKNKSIKDSHYNNNNKIPQLWPFVGSDYENETNFSRSRHLPRNMAFWWPNRRVRHHRNIAFWTEILKFLLIEISMAFYLKQNHIQSRSIICTSKLYIF